MLYSNTSDLTKPLNNMAGLPDWIDFGANEANLTTFLPGRTKLFAPGLGPFLFIIGKIMGEK